MSNWLEVVINPSQLAKDYHNRPNPVMSHPSLTLPRAGHIAASHLNKEEVKGYHAGTCSSCSSVFWRPQSYLEGPNKKVGLGVGFIFQVWLMVVTNV